MKKFLHIVTMLVLACMLTLSVFSFAGCSTKKDPNKIYVGMECGYAPFNYTQTTDTNGAVKISNANGYANGYDVMIAKKIAESLGKVQIRSPYPGCSGRQSRLHHRRHVPHRRTPRSRGFFGRVL